MKREKARKRQGLVIGVSGINAIDNPGPGVGIARALKEDRELNATIVGLAYDAMEPGIYMDWLIDRAFIVPYPSGGAEPLLERLRYVKQQCGLDFIIPCLDAELPIFTKERAAIEKMGIRTYLPTLEQLKLRGKDRLTQVAEKIGIDVPKTTVAGSPDEVARAVDDLGIPVMVKGLFYKAYRAYTTKEAVDHSHRIAAEWGWPIIVQQAVTGDELNVVGVGDGEGGSLGLVGIKKMGTTALGKIWTGVTVKHERMLQAAERFVREYRWKGPFELECIVDGDDVSLIEINPRFPAWSYFAAGVGVNLPAAMVRSAFGLPSLARHDYEAGKLFIRYTYEVVTDMRPFQEIMTKGER